jgi:glycerophosphoryl diester phosphodiesterase
VSAFAGEGPVVVVGHRGGRGEDWPPENTLEAFARALEEGARAIELDVRACATGEAVVFHDPQLGRMTGGDDMRKVAQLPMRDLVRVRLTGGARVPTLAEVLDWSRTRCAVNVELKHDVPSRASLARAAAKHIREARPDVLVSSFDPELLTTMRALLPRTPRAHLTLPGARPTFPPLGLHAVHYAREQATAENIALAKKHGLRVGVWTVNDAGEAKDLAKRGAQWIITDDPKAIARALGA